MVREGRDSYECHDRFILIWISRCRSTTKKTKEFKDGCRVVVDGTGKKTQYNVDGSKIEFFPDGTRVDTSADGHAVRKVEAAATKVENQVSVHSHPNWHF